MDYLPEEALGIKSAMNRSYLVNPTFCLCILLLGGSSNFTSAEQIESPQISTSTKRIAPDAWLETEANKMLSEIDRQRPALEKDEQAFRSFFTIPQSLFGIQDLWQKG